MGASTPVQRCCPKTCRIGTLFWMVFSKGLRANSRQNFSHWAKAVLAAWAQPEEIPSCTASSAVLRSQAKERWASVRAFERAASVDLKI